MTGAAVVDLHADGWNQVADLAVAVGMTAVIGLERELRQKSAGLRTHTLVGIGAALFMLVSKYGFGDVLAPGRSVVDPSRVAAQIVTGIGFLGAGIIFVRGRGVKGLTTAASVWVTAAVGAAAGAGLPLLAGATTVAYLVVAVGFSAVTARLAGPQPAVLHVQCSPGATPLATVLAEVARRGFALSSVRVTGPGSGERDVELHILGSADTAPLVGALGALDGVVSVVLEGPADEP